MPPPGRNPASTEKLALEVERLRAAAALGSAEAMFKLGEKAELGEGLPADAAEAARWWRDAAELGHCLLYTSPSPRDRTRSRMPSSA